MITKDLLLKSGDDKFIIESFKSILNTKYNTLDIKIFEMLDSDYINEIITFIHNILNQKSYYDIKICNIYLNQQDYSIYIFKLIDCLQVNNIQVTIINSYTEITLSK